MKWWFGFASKLFPTFMNQVMSFNQVTKNIKMKKILLIATLFGFQLSTVLAQQLKATDSRIVEVYGTYAQQLTPEQLAWEQAKLDRTEVRKMPVTASEKFQKLSSLQVITKFVPTLTMEATFNPAKINPLKYAISFVRKEDQTFRIDNTEYVLVIAKKK